MNVKQLGKCNAYVEHDSIGDSWEFYKLVSYCTEVALVLCRGGRIVRVDLGAAAHCSASTTRQVKRFLDAYAPDYAFVALEQTDNDHGYSLKAPLSYDCQTDMFEYDFNSLGDKPDRTPYKDFNNGYMTVRGMHRG